MNVLEKQWWWKLFCFGITKSFYNGPYSQRRTKPILKDGHVPIESITVFINIREKSNGWTRCARMPLAEFVGMLASDDPKVALDVKEGGNPPKRKKIPVSHMEIQLFDVDKPHRLNERNSWHPLKSFRAWIKTCAAEGMRDFEYSIPGYGAHQASRHMLRLDDIEIPVHLPGHERGRLTSEQLISLLKERIETIPLILETW